MKPAAGVGRFVAVLSGEALVLLAILTLIPGPDTFLTLRQGLVGGLRLAWPTIAGISTGTVVHATVSGAGLALLFKHSPTAFRVVQFAGVGYLAFLGIRSLWSALNSKPSEVVESDSRRSGGWRGYRDGLATNLLNPKVALFYLAFLSPYIPAGQDILLTSMLYGLCHAIMGEVQLGSVAILADQVRTRVASPGFRRGTEAVAGTVLLLFALRLAMDR
ncbi:MAG: LysE family translocator [Candidatus Thermoplasmatota archaeon]